MLRIYEVGEKRRGTIEGEIDDNTPQAGMSRLIMAAISNRLDVNSLDVLHIIYAGA